MVLGKSRGFPGTSAILQAAARLNPFRHRESGKSIRRRIERRFDAVQAQVAHGDPEVIQRLPHARWLLDNSHLVRQALQQIETDLPAAYHRQLPTIVTANGRKSTRAFALAEQAIDQSGLPIDIDAIARFCRDYRSTAETDTRLTLGELWVIPTALRITLLTRLCAAAEHDPRPAAKGDDIESNVDITTIAGCITSIRTVATTNWSDFVEQTSVVERRLQTDPSGFYQQMDFYTRDRYRQAVEQIARRTKIEQYEVADAALQLAQGNRKTQQHENHKHIGYFLVDDGRRALERSVNYHLSIADRIRRAAGRQTTAIYILAISGLAAWACVTLVFALGTYGANLAMSVTVGIIAAVPLLSVSSGAVNFVVSLVAPPRWLPKLDFSAGIPPEQQTIVVVPMLLSSAAEIAENLATLERNYLGNADPALQFALLSDHTDATAAVLAEDQVLLDHAVAGIDALNNRYGTDGIRPFLLFHRRRLWNESSRLWMGWERKRGKLEEFNELLRGATDTSFVLQHGDHLPRRDRIRFVITLDADSYMPTGAARKLIGAIAHPLNRPRFDEKTGKVVGGYTVLQPRLETNPVNGADTAFARIFAGDVTLDLYTNAVSDVYQDLFGEAVFAGKGIYDVDAFRRSVSDQIPSNTVLSHDLLEGLLGRAGLVSDIVFLENYPANYLVYLKRLHRWVRGDWQLLPWLFSSRQGAPRPFQPGAIGRWKLFDNLRRSLLTPAILILLMLGWTALPGNPVVWTLLFALFPGLPILLRITLALRTSLWRWGSIRSSTRNLAEHAGADASRWILALVFLPAEAYVVADAVLRTIYRLTISRRRMLEWSTAAQVSRMLGGVNDARAFWRTLWFAPVAASMAGVAIFAFNPPAFPAASALLCLWLISPLLALQLGRRAEERPELPLSDVDIRLIRGIARDTWRFFERFVGPETNWLPPDNVQEYPSRVSAERTSPTNIGMLLLSTLSAYDFGYLGQRELFNRLGSHLDSVQKLRKHRGHLFNWYSTRDLLPLEPRYVSTVDSGNFIAALIVVRQALEALPDHTHPVERTISGLVDELDGLHRQLFSQESTETEPSVIKLLESLEVARAKLSDTEQPLFAAQRTGQQVCEEIEAAFLYALEHAPNHWSAEEIARFRENSTVFRQRIRIILSDLETFAPWSERLFLPPVLLTTATFRPLFESMSNDLDIARDADGLSERYAAAFRSASAMAHKLDTHGTAREIDEAKEWLEELQRDLANALHALEEQDRRRRALIHTTTQLIESTDFRFLYDFNRDLFRVGYNATTGEADGSYYDLLASEARIASYIAIAKGDIPAKHWMHLGRPLTRIRGLRMLLSWSATAFEYLMPRLLMRSPASGLLGQSCEGIVREQIRFAQQHDVPWGISESGYAQFDAQNHYQYYAFGIPKLGLKWDQGERLVISSYSSVLALPYAPAKVIENLRRLIDLGAAGAYGLYEALDFGDTNKPRPARPRVVQSYMAHHQGMILVAIGNALHRDETLQRFHRDPHIASVEHLLHERLPQRMQTRALERLPSPLKELPAAPATVTQWAVEPNVPELAILSNGRLSSRISDQGGGALFWRGMAATRWAPLAEGRTGGSRIYFKDLDNDRVRCVGGEPLPDDVETLFAPHLVEFRARRDEILVRMMITIAPTSDTEIRRITITNDGPTTRHIMLSSYCEPVLGPEAADQRHHAFNKLFIESQHLDDEQTLLFRRRPREPDEPPMYLAHTAVTHWEREIAREVETDRNAFLGRLADPAKPAALTESNHPFQPTPGNNLDPCAAVVLSLDIPPRSTVQCAFLTAVADNRTGVLDALRPYQSLDRIDWTVEAARLHSEQELTAQRVGSSDVQAAFRLLGKLVWPRDISHIGNNAFDNIRHVQDALWRQGISGDRPVAALRLDGEEDLKPAELILKATRYLSSKDFALDLVFLDETEGGYAVPTNDRLRQLIERNLAFGRERDGARAYTVPARNLSADEKLGLIAAARLFVDNREHSATGWQDSTVKRPMQMPAFVPRPSAPLSGHLLSPVTLQNDLLFSNRFGGMSPDFDAYVMLISGESRTPAPWCNVLANPDFGSLVSESGSMCTWRGNSSENRLTPWNNDPVLDQTGEAIYARDEETGESWSLTPQACSDTATYRVTHAIGETVFEHNRHGLEQRLQVFVDQEHPVKYLRIGLTNKWGRGRRLTVTFAVEWLLGNTHSYSRHLLFPERDAETGALLVQNGFARHNGEELAFVGSSLPAHGVTCDGNEFFGKQRSWTAPAGLSTVGLSDRVAPNAFPCAVYQVHIDMAANANTEFHFVLGGADNRNAATRLINNACRPEWVDQRYRSLGRHWRDMLDNWQVKTPDIAFDAIVNRWLLYQVVSSRLWGRIGFYQASGGFGFRDQLQDVLALLDAAPELARAQILLAAARQFDQGDVLHWWHEAPLRGVRTRISDDLLWLPYAVAEYIDVSGDFSILDDSTAFLQGEPLGEHETERYAEYSPTEYVGSIYEHCYRAIDARIRFGAHNLPLIGTGDWNDGLNRVGEKGRGESVWMAWFLVDVCRRFAPLCRQQDDNERAEYYERIAGELLARTQETAWTGMWYLRGYFDDGTPLGAPGDAESEIDLNAQTWAVLVDPQNSAARKAMRAAEEKLMDADNRLIKLLAPPFEKTQPDPGYIRSYPPGVRENGGQYTHAAVWAPWAAVASGNSEKALRWFDWLNPLKRACSDAEIERYRLEPYVTPGDVYGVDSLAGRGGWSWYTGSAAWLYRLAVRQMLGLQRRGKKLYVRPCLPGTWTIFEAILRQEGFEHRIRVHSPAKLQHDKLFMIVNETTIDAEWVELKREKQRIEIFPSDASRRDWLATASPPAQSAASAHRQNTNESGTTRA